MEQGQIPPPPQGGFPAPGATPPPSAAPTPSPIASTPGGSPPRVSRDEALGFARSLFDFSFSSFVSPRVLKVLYGLHLFMIIPATFVLMKVWWNALTYERYNGEWDPQFGLFCGSTVVFPFAIAAWVLIGRVLFERGILAFRQYDIQREMLEELRRGR